MRALSRSGCSQNQVLKALPALLALVFVDWHKGSFPAALADRAPSERGTNDGFYCIPAIICMQ